MNKEKNHETQEDIQNDEFLKTYLEAKERNMENFTSNKMICYTEQFKKRFQVWFHRDRFRVPTINTKNLITHLHEKEVKFNCRRTESQKLTDSMRQMKCWNFYHETGYVGNQIALT